MHGGKRYRQSRRFFPGHIPIRHGLHAAHIGNSIFGITAGTRAHHAITGLDANHARANRRDFPGKFKAQDGASTAHAPMCMPCRHAKISAVQPRRTHPYQHLFGPGHRARRLLHLHAFSGNHRRLHCFGHDTIPLRLSGLESE